jgi:lipopolysaccharide O-acetyltransferase
MLKIILKYRIFGMFRLLMDLIFSKLLYPEAGLLRRPFYIRNEGKIKFGHGFTAGPGLILDTIGVNSAIIIGSDVKANHSLHIGAAQFVSIGDRVLIASGVYISDHGHGSYSGLTHTSPAVPPNQRVLEVKPVYIGDDVWIGERAVILPGVNIGRGVVVGAGAVVTSDLPEYTVAVGIPARVIKKFNFDSKKWTNC